MSRVLFFCHNFPPAVDGGSRLLAMLAEREKQKGNRVLVLASDAFSTDDYLDPKKKRLKEIGKTRGIRVIRIKTWRRPKWLIRRITGPVFLLPPLRLIKRWRPELIIAGVFPTTVPVYAWLLAKITGAKLTILPCFHPEDRCFHHFLLINILKRADEVIALSRFEKNYYQTHFGIKKEKIIIFRPSLNRKFILKKDQKAKFHPPPTVLFLGNQAAHKKIEVLINAFRIVAKNNLSARLVVAGGETLHSPAIRKKIAGLPKNIRQKIKVYGHFSQKQEKRLLDRAWVLANPSVHESLGLVFLEAWARKKPVIGANIPALQEVIKNGKNGLLFEKNNSANLAKKINLLIGNKKKAVKMGEAGWKILKTDVLANNRLKVRDLLGR